MPVITEGEPLRRVLDLLNSPERAVLDLPTSPWGPATTTPGPRPASIAIRDRRAIRDYDARPIGSGLLTELLREGRDIGAECTVLVDARRLSDREPGLYLAEPAADYALPAQADLRSIPGLGEQYADAAALLMICGDLTSACASDGANGYSRLLVQAGAFGHATWLAAVSRGLVGCVFGRSHHGVTAAARQARGQRHLFTLAVGYPLPCTVENPEATP